MLKTKIFYIILFLISCYSTKLYSNINIVVKIENEIITNRDIQKEIGYLKTLNPKLKQLNNNQILEIAKDSLINQEIKKKEINKFLKKSSKEKIVEQYLDDLVSKLNLKDIDSLMKQLIMNNSYSISEIKKKIEIDLLWNELIVLKYKNQIDVDEKKILKQIDEKLNFEEKEYFLSEIVFVKQENIMLEDYINQIKLSINEIGFENTANIFSISESSKFGGKIGWVSKTSLSNKILEKLIDTNVGYISDPIQMGNAYLILKIENIRDKKILLDKEEELRKLTNSEINSQLNKFSTIYFNKSKKNYKIN